MFILYNQHNMNNTINIEEENDALEAEIKQDRACRISDLYNAGLGRMDGQWYSDNCDCDNEEGHDHQCATRLSDDEIIALGNE